MDRQQIAKAAILNQIEPVKDFLRHTPMVKFAYLFGSHARENAGVLSDIDIAAYLDRRLDAFRYRLILMEELARVLKGADFDLITLNDAPLTLQYEIIRDGKVLKEDKRRRVDFETRVLSRYLDTAHLRKTRQHDLKERFMREDGLG